MINADIPISRYSVIQAGANNQLGGVKGGFSRVAYHVGIAAVVNREPMRPAHWQRAILISSLKMSLSFLSPMVCLPKLTAGESCLLQAAFHHTPVYIVEKGLSLEPLPAINSLAMAFFMA